MISPITKDGVLLKYAKSVVEEIDQVIDRNLDKPTLVALFISRLLKGFQDLTNAEYEVRPNWGTYTYEIEDIAIVSFKMYCDASDGSIAIAIDSIQWTFATSRFFSDFAA